MAIYTGTADANGDFSIAFGTSYTGGQKVTVTAEKDAATKSIELFAPSSAIGGGVIQFSGNMTSFPNNIGTVTLKSEITNIPNNSFDATTVGSLWAKATGLVIESATSIGNSAFSGWSALKALTLNPGLTNIGSYAFSGHKITSVNIPASVTTIGTYAFNQATTITSITFATDSLLDNIGDYAFTTVTGLTAPLILPASLKTIGAGAFRYPRLLKSLKIGPNILSIGASAFAEAFVLEELIIEAATPPTITASTFTSLNAACVIKVPAASLSSYQAAANWSAHASKMIGI